MLSVRKIYFSIHSLYCKLIKLQFTVSVALALCSGWLKLLGKTYYLQWQNGVMVSDSFAFSKCKSFRQHVLFVWGWSLRIKCFCDWMAKGKLWMIKTYPNGKNIWNAKVDYTLRCFFHWQLKLEADTFNQLKYTNIWLFWNDVIALKRTEV